MAATVRKRAPKIAGGNRLSRSSQKGTDQESHCDSQRQRHPLQGNAHRSASGMECTPSPTAG